MTSPDPWITVNAERALYVDRGRDVILCDRLPEPVTLVLKLSEVEMTRLRQSNNGEAGE